MKSVILNRRGQVTAFVVVAIVIVVSAILYFSFRSISEPEQLSSSFEPIYSRFTQCLMDYSKEGISIMSSTGGYIEMPEFEPGSRYSPTSSQMSFAGVEIPYWNYISAAGILKTQIPEKSDMENYLSGFIDERIRYCSLKEFVDSGYSIRYGEPTSSVSIGDDYIDVSLDMEIFLSKDMESSVVKNHEVRINTNFGALYKEALNLYEKEQSEMFLENYTIDVLRLYLPVDGVEFTCSPLVFGIENLYENLRDALEVNYLSLKNKGSDDDYFTIDFSQDVDVKFIYSNNWPTYMEVNPSEGNTLVAKPVGNQQGLGILGFCYVPYHFVYNIKHPVLAQVSMGEETFQFPMTVSIDGNLPRSGKADESVVLEIEDFCEDSNTQATVSVYDSNLEPVDAMVSYSCFGASCDMGSTENGEIDSEFPQCVNGILSVNAPGFRESSNTFSVVEDGSSIVVILEKEYEREVEIIFDGNIYSGNAAITFLGEDVKSIYYPQQKTVTLSPGEYNVSVYLYDNSSLTIEAGEREFCTNVLRPGLLGMAGFTKEECTTINTPEQIITTALIGGGEGIAFFSDFDLEGANKIQIIGSGINIPNTLDDLQNNYILIETNNLEVGVK